jgi:GNAT superfamily N-acetyltransferase
MLGNNKVGINDENIQISREDQTSYEDVYKFFNEYENLQFFLTHKHKKPPIYYIARDNLGTICGALEFFLNDDDFCEIYVLLVSEKWRSKGIGSLLMNHVIEDADTNGYTLKVTPSPDKEHLVRFYGKFGFSKNYNETLRYYSREMYRKPFNINTFKSLYMSEYKNYALFKNPFSTMKSLIEKNPDLSMREVHQYARKNRLSRTAKVLWRPNQSEVARIYNSHSEFSLPLQGCKL